jgi:hypothetical protein
MLIAFPRQQWWYKHINAMFICILPVFLHTININYMQIKSSKKISPHLSSFWLKVHPNIQMLKESLSTITQT